MIIFIFLLFVGFLSAEPQRPHSQILNERIIELSQSLNSEEAVYEVSILSEALNVADTMALQYFKDNCVPGGLFEPKSNDILCTKYPQLIVRQIKSRISSLYGKYLFAGGSIKLPEMWLHHSRSLLTRLQGEDKENDANYYRAMLMLAKLLEDSIVIKQENKIASLNGFEAIKPSEQANKTEGEAFKEQPIISSPSKCNHQNHPEPPPTSSHCTAPITQTRPVSVPCNEVQLEHQRQLQHQQRKLLEQELIELERENQLLQRQFEDKIQHEKQKQQLQLQLQLQQQQQHLQQQQHIQQHLQQVHLQQRFPNHPDLNQVLHGILPGIPEELLREKVTSKRPSEIQILL